MICSCCYVNSNDEPEIKFINFENNGNTCHSLCHDCLENRVSDGNLKIEDVNDDMNFICNWKGNEHKCSGSISISTILQEVQYNEKLFKKCTENLIKIYADRKTKNVMSIEDDFIRNISMTNCPNCNGGLTDIIDTDADKCSAMSCPHCNTIFCKACKYYVTKEAATDYIRIQYYNKNNNGEEIINIDDNGNVQRSIDNGEYNLAIHEHFIHQHIWRRHEGKGIKIPKEELIKIQKREILRKIEIFTNKLDQNQKDSLWNNSLIQEHLNTLKERFGYSDIDIEAAFMNNWDVIIGNDDNVEYAYEPPNFITRFFDNRAHSKGVKNLRINFVLSIGEILIDGYILNGGTLIATGFIFLSSNILFLSLEEKIQILIKNIIPFEYIFLIYSYVSLCANTGVIAYVSGKYIYNSLYSLYQKYKVYSIASAAANTTASAKAVCVAKATTVAVASTATLDASVAASSVMINKYAMTNGGLILAKSGSGKIATAKLVSLAKAGILSSKTFGAGSVVTATAAETASVTTAYAAAQTGLTALIVANPITATACATAVIGGIAYKLYNRKKICD